MKIVFFAALVISAPAGQKIELLDLQPELLDIIMSSTETSGLRSISETSKRLRNISLPFLEKDKSRIHLESFCSPTVSMALNNNPISIFSIPEGTKSLEPSFTTKESIKCLTSFVSYRNEIKNYKEFVEEVNPFKLQIPHNLSLFRDYRDTIKHIASTKLYLEHPSSREQTVYLEILSKPTKREEEFLSRYLTLLRTVNIKYLQVQGCIETFYNLLETRNIHFPTLLYLKTVSNSPIHKSPFVDRNLSNIFFKFIENRFPNLEKLSDSFFIEDNQLQDIMFLSSKSRLISINSQNYMNTYPEMMRVDGFSLLINSDHILDPLYFESIYQRSNLISKLSFHIDSKETETWTHALHKILRNAHSLEYLVIRVELQCSFDRIVNLDAIDLSFLTSLENLKYFEFSGVVGTRTTKTIAHFVQQSKSLESLNLKITALATCRRHSIMYSPVSIHAVIFTILKNIKPSSRLEELNVKSIMTIGPNDNLRETIGNFCKVIWTALKNTTIALERDLAFNGIPINKAFQNLDQCNSTKLDGVNRRFITMDPVFVPKYSVNMF